MQCCWQEGERGEGNEELEEGGRGGKVRAAREEGRGRRKIKSAGESQFSHA